MNSRGKMLCVDDHPDLRQSLQNQFEAENFAVDTAQDGLEALEKIRGQEYDIVLLDMKMPNLDGMGVLRSLRGSERFPKIVMLTAVDEVETAMECVKMGARDYISKPYDPEELTRVVNKILSV